MRNADVISYVKAATKARWKRIFAAWVILVAALFSGIRLSNIEYTARVKIFASLPSSAGAIANLPFAGHLNALERDLLLTSQESIIYSQSIYESVKERLIRDLGQAKGVEPPLFATLRKQLKTLLFGSVFVENHDRWTNHGFADFKRRIAFKPNLDEGNFDITFVSDDPEYAIRAAGFIAEELIEKNVEISNLKWRSMSEFLGNKVQEIEADLKQVESQIAAFARDNRLVMTDSAFAARYERYLANKERLSQAVIELNAKLAGIRHRAESLESLRERTVSALTNDSRDRIEALREQIRVLETVISQSDGSKDRATLQKKLEAHRNELRRELEETSDHASPEEIKALVGASELEFLRAQGELVNAQKMLEGITRAAEESTKELEQLPDVYIQFERLLFRQNQLAKVLETLMQNYMNALIQSESQVANLFVIEEPHLLEGFTASMRVKLMALAMIFAALMSTFLFVSLDYFRDVVHLGEQLNRVPGVAYLGAIKTVPAADLAAPRTTLSVSAVANTMAKYARNENGDAPKVVFFTSAGPCSGKSTTCFLVANALARKDLKVLVIDFDIFATQRNLSHLYAQAERAIPSVRFTIKGADLEAGLTPAGLPHSSGTRGNEVYVYSFVPKGPVAFGNPVKILREVLNEAKEEFDFIFVDGAPIGVEYAAESLELAEGVVICCLESRDRLKDVAKTAAVVESCTAPGTKVFSICAMSRSYDTAIDNQSYYRYRRLRAA